MVKREMRHYEIAYLVSLSKNWNVTAFFKNIDALVINSGGRIHKHESWGKRILSYKIKNNTLAFFYCLYVECDAKLLGQLREIFWNSRRVLRFLVVRRESATAQMKASTKDFKKRKRK
ncbi:30S ribosomal subunit protein S6 [Candidatus Tremblaya phenacola PAVE]|nr:30S ribosomal subunit protein S6 [Candidatus Tremblaya phenacola PAVE]